MGKNLLDTTVLMGMLFLGPASLSALVFGYVFGWKRSWFMGDIHIGVLRMIRVFRLLRIIRRLTVLRIFGTLRVLFVSIADSMESLFWIYVALCAITYIVAVLQTDVVINLKNSVSADDDDYIAVEGLIDN